MPLYVSGNSSGADFQPHPAGPYPARCTRIIDLGSQPTTFKGQSRLTHKILFGFQSSELMPDGDKKGQPYLVTSKYSASLSDKALLRRDLESWRGRRFTPQEIERFNLENVLGKPALLNIIHSKPDAEGKVWANIQSIMTLPPAMTAPQATEPPIFFSLSAFDQSVFDKLSDKLKEIISSSPEYQALKAGKPAGDGQPALAGIDDDLDGDIPF